MQDIRMPVYLNLIKYYGHRWWDTSTFTPRLQAFFMDELETYEIDSINVDSLPLVPDAEGRLTYFRATFTQSRKNITTQWSVDSIDLILGFIGGMSEVIWTILAGAMTSYLNFNFESGMIRNFYGISRMHPGSDTPNSNELAEQEVKKSIASRRKYNYTYTEFITTRLMKVLCF